MGIRLGFETAYIDGSVASSLAYRPQFVSNNYKEGKKVLSSIEDELLKCDQFQISVGYLIAISRSRVSSPFNTYLGEAIALLFMILLIFLICLAPVDISVCVKKIWFISGTVKALFVFLEMKNSFDAMNYFGPRAVDVVSYIGWNLYQVVIIVAYLLAGLWVAKSVKDTI